METVTAFSMLGVPSAMAVYSSFPGAVFGGRQCCATCSCRFDQKMGAIACSASCCMPLSNRVPRKMKISYQDTMHFRNPKSNYSASSETEMVTGLFSSCTSDSGFSKRSPRGGIPDLHPAPTFSKSGCRVSPTWRAKKIEQSPRW